MKLYVFDIPETPEELPRWLEQHLVGTHLAELVAELTAVHGAANGQASGRREPPGEVAPDTSPHRKRGMGGEQLDQILGSSREQVLSQGLASLPHEKLPALLRQPLLLVELQGLVLGEGGAYWTKLAGAGEAAAAARHLRERVLPLPATQAVVVAPRRPPTYWYQHPVPVSLATTAVLLVGLFFLFQQFEQPPAPAAWGWNRPDILAPTASREAYLTGLATAADEWFTQQPAEPRALATRIAQFRGGCSTLILSKHPPLTGADRTWLKDKCRAWAAKIDGHLTALEAGGDVAEVRSAMDETVRKLSTAIRDRAQSPAS